MRSLPHPLSEAAHRAPPLPAIDPGAQFDMLMDDMDVLYRERNAARAQLPLAHDDALFKLAVAAGFRDDDTGIQIVRVGFLAEALALALGQPAGWSAMLRKAAPMHDVGKIGIPDAVLKKAGGFTPQERNIMNRHAEIGCEILGRTDVPVFRLAAEVSLQHHERFDGQGYPQGRAGKAIALSGRIVAVVDFFDALGMRRCYRPAMGDDTVRTMVLAERGRAFDPDVVDALLAGWPRFLALRDHVTDQRMTFGDLARPLQLEQECMFATLK
ncbi:putative two-component system response regulator [Variovorax sp. GrIS 2.14]|uniref:HD-GYP domain-containing protein n=1 Tax=Variovorax sp. GrIS 2.14 TaxID=3071709 RepID=UPI0038F65DE5